MSIEVILIPIGLAAYRMLKEYRRTDLCEGCKQTRLTDAALLCRALERIGAWDIVQGTSNVTARSARGPLYFQLVEGVFLGRVDNGSEDESRALIGDLDDAVGRIVQSDQVETMRTRAAQLGLRLVGEDVAERN